MSTLAPKCRPCCKLGPGRHPHSCDIKHQLKAEPADPGRRARHGFEKRSAMKAEARFRADALRRQISELGVSSRTLGFSRFELLPVADYLEDNIESLNPDGSPACPTEKRAYRRQLLSSVLMYLMQFESNEIRTLTLLNSSWRVSAYDLLKFVPRRALAQFRQHLNRSQIAGLKGFLIAFLDCEYEPVEQVFVFHLQGIGTVEKVEALRRLKAYDKWGYEKSPTGSPPLVVKRIAHLPRQVSYLDKGFSVAKGVREVDGVMKRDRNGQRIPEPFHSLYLLWLFQQRNSDLRLFIGVRLAPCGHLRAA